MHNEDLYYIWLSDTLNPGSCATKILFDSFSYVEEIYNADKEQYAALGISRSDCVKLSNKNLDRATSLLNFCKKEHIGLLGYNDPYYPERLKMIDNPPPLFYYKGRLNYLDDYPCFTMVGTRSCSERGFRLAYEIAYDAASKGAIIINGLALGIDGACLTGALDANGYAVGILGCGIDRIYPTGNKDLFSRLEASGLIISEFSPFSKPDGKNFPIRNRVLSGISLATCIFEADAETSGAMITARNALSQGKRIFAVPAKPYDKSYSGALELIKDGACIFTEADDILTEYSLNFPHRINLANKNEVPSEKLDRYVAKYFKKGTNPEMPVNRRFVFDQNKQQEQSKTSYNLNKEDIKKSQAQQQQVQKRSAAPEQKQLKNNEAEKADLAASLSVLSASEKMVYDLFSQKESLTVDEIAQNDIDVGDILSALTLLEIYGLIKSLPGGRYTKNV